MFHVTQIHSYSGTTQMPPKICLKNLIPSFILDVGKCQVLYDYEPQQSDELKIVEGDLINVIDKQEDDWWQGELNGIVGIFPATYVQEIVNGNY